MLAPYFSRPMVFIRFLNPVHLSLLAAGVIARCSTVAVPDPRLRRSFDRSTTGIGVGRRCGSCLRIFVREPGGMVAPQDAYALRTFADFYLTAPGLLLP